MLSPFWYFGDGLAVDLPADFPLGAVGRAGVLCCEAAWDDDEANGMGPLDIWAMSIGWAGLDCVILC